MHTSVEDILIEKDFVIKFAPRCRDVDRQYEFNNNGDLDNGVYNKFVLNGEKANQGEEKGLPEDLKKDD
jgi:hypothetical protein